MIDKGIRYEVQGGVKNYLGKQKEVKAPVKWKSSPNHPETELAYITKKERDLLIKSDLHGSLKGSVNRGPSGIISLNGWGDASDGFGGGSSSGGGNSGGGNGGGGGGGRQDTESQYGSGSYGSYDPSKNVSTREQQYGGNNDGPTPRDLAMGAGGKQKKGTITDIEELSKATGTDFSGGARTSPALEKARLANVDLVKELTDRPFQGVNVPPYIPFSGAINVLGNLLGGFGYEKNKEFFQKNVAGKYGYGYGIEDYEQYMDDRMSGKVGAYGNEEQGENALRGIGGGNDRVDTSGILENLLQPGIFPGEESPGEESPGGFKYIPYSNQVVIAPGIEGLRSLIGSNAFKSIIK